MSADVLREAAALMRSRAEAASGSADAVDEWVVDYIDEEAAVSVRYDDEIGDVTGLVAWATAEHIASWHPAVSLAVADLLEAADANYDPEFPEDAESWDFYQRAISLARAYLGSNS